MEIPSIAGKKLIVFDLDGTITLSKSPMDEEMAGLFRRILDRMSIAVITGGAFERFALQFQSLNCTPQEQERLYFFPTSGTRFYRFHHTNGWEEVYADVMTPEERKKIQDAFEQAYHDIDYHHPLVTYGEIVEDRGTQVTFSAVGQQAPLEVKEAWRAQHDRRPELAEAVQKYLPEFEVKIPGMSSIDVTRKGIDKGYGIEQMVAHLGTTIDEMIFVGDALYEGGNDFPVIRTGIQTVAVNHPEETKHVLRQWLKEINA